jgi:hypothetical protein
MKPSIDCIRRTWIAAGRIYRRQLSTDKNTGQEERFARFLRLTSLVVAGGMAAWKLLAFQ